VLTIVCSFGVRLLDRYIAFVFCLIFCLLAVEASARPNFTNTPLEPVSFETFERLFPINDNTWSRKSDLLRGIENSLQYLRSSDSERAYKKYQGTVLDRDKVLRSLLRFRTLLFKAKSPVELTSMLKKEFRVMRSKGSDGEGAVKFTGYFQPVYRASLKRSEQYSFPLYSLPEDFASWSKPHYRRVELEGYDGLGAGRGPLRGREIAYLPTRYEAYMIQVQGSAILELPDGKHLAVGFAGATDHPFKGVPKSFLQAKNIRWANIGEHFRAHPADLNQILAQNNRFVFFKVNQFQDPVGSLGVPVVAKRSIATDKSLMPPGALGLIHTFFPERNTRSGTISMARRPQFVFDHDTGSAIKGPGRVDVFMGTGDEAGKLANHISSTGSLYYLLLK